mmetsp:Transcript_38223/g.65569  ORF Transcript_38223/g.65569 Transcript_38223/m.65569 type:complete len:436 (+) Transcript_38223:52-1359(+)
MGQSISLSKKCSSSSSYLILYRRLRRTVLNHLGIVLWNVFGYRKDISWECILRESGRNENDLPPATLKLFKCLSNSWNEDPLLTLSGRILLKNYYCDILNTRERIKEVYSINKEYIEKNNQIRKPLFIVGWPRVGSTFMHKLLSCDPQCKGPPLWQLVNPVPSNFDNIKKEDEIRNTQLLMDYYFDLEPELYMLHEMNAENADECCHLFEQNWVDRHSVIISENMSSYLELLNNLTLEEQIEIYQFYKETLQVMMFLNKDSPISHHILKDATHYMFIEGLLAVFPDANILLMNRKPSSVAKSCLSGIGLVGRYYYDRKTISNFTYSSHLANRTLSWMELSQERGNLYLPKNNTITGKKISQKTIQFEEFIKDPISTVKEIYDYFGYEYSLEFEENMKQFINNYNSFRKSKPTFIHTTEPFGLNEKDIDNMFTKIK